MIRFQKWIIAIGLCSLLMIPTTAFAEQASQTNQASQDVSEVLQLLSTYHVSGVSKEQLSKDAIQGMIQALDDRYTVYFSKSDFQNFSNALEENYVGIGVKLGLDKQGYFIDEVFSKSPAETAGLRQGDYIINVSGQMIKGKSSEALMKLIKGPEGTTVTITIDRSGVQKQMKVARKKIQLPVVTSKWFPDGTGYIKIDTFSSKAGTLFKQHLNAWKTKGMHALIIDLRNNPGGLLVSAKEIASLFVKQGTLIHTLDRNGVDQPVQITNGATVSYPVVLLVNENSASASEILTGVFEDYHVATVVGTKTYGKGSVQNIFTLSSGSVLKETIAHYVTPKYREVNKVGLEPDIHVKGAIPQLITSLFTAGEKDLTVTLEAHQTVINQIPFNNSVHVIQDGEHIYVPSRVLAALIQARIDWNGEEKKITISNLHSSKSYTLNAPEIRVLNDTSYIELHDFTKIFSTLQWSLKSNQLVFRVKKELR